MARQSQQGGPQPVVCHALGQLGDQGCRVGRHAQGHDGISVSHGRSLRGLHPQLDTMDGRQVPLTFQGPLQGRELIAQQGMPGRGLGEQHQPACLQIGHPAVWPQGFGQQLAYLVVELI